MLASVSTRVVSWNDAAEMNESVESDAFVIPSSSGRPCAGRLPSAITRSFSSRKRLDVLVVDIHALQPVDLLDLVHQVPLQRLLTEDVQDVVRVARPIH